MNENLVGYLLGALDPESHRQVEDRAREDPVTARQLETLRRALEPLALDREPPEPAAGLAMRTLARVAEYRCRPLPAAPAPPPERAAFSRRWWRPRPDLLVAASLLILLGGIGVPALVHLRREHNKQACGNNLRLFHQALDAYSANNHHEYPQLGDKAPHNVAGMFAPMLREAGVLPQDLAIHCPANDGPSPQELQAMNPEEFRQAARGVTDCYAYTLGYRDANGACHGLRNDDTEINRALLPILADCPHVRGPNGQNRGNSPNHSGGQNVLYLDGHVHFWNNPHAGVEKDNIYLNKRGQVGAGVDPWDTVLGRGDDRP